MRIERDDAGLWQATYEDENNTCQIGIKGVRILVNTRDMETLQAIRIILELNRTTCFGLKEAKDLVCFVRDTL